MCTSALISKHVGHFLFRVLPVAVSTATPVSEKQGFFECAKTILSLMTKNLLFIWPIVICDILVFSHE